MESLNGDSLQRLQFRYDPQGRRILKEVYETGPSKTKGRKAPKWKLTKQHHYIYDGWNMIAETDDQDALIRTYLWGIDLSGSLQGAGGVGGLLKSANQQDKRTIAPHFDGNGNIVQYVDSLNGDEVIKFAYDPFGSELNKAKNLDDRFPFRFSTKFTDDETGLNYYGFRYYKPETGRWLIKDPIEEMDDINLYGFIRNKANNGWDRLGLDSSFGGLEGFDTSDCCLSGNYYTRWETIATSVQICREPGLISHEYVVVNGFRVDFSTNDRTVSGIFSSPAVVKISPWIPVPSDTCENVHFSPCRYGSDNLKSYADEVLKNAYNLRDNPGTYNVICRSCRELDILILP